jgi:high-affinity Fe2+/Pb2+ permease
MGKLFAFLTVLRKGHVVANPAAWKAGQITGSVVAGALAAVVALAKVYGYELPLSDEELLAIGSAIVAIVGLFISPAVTVASSDKVGLPAESKDRTEKQVRIPGHSS